MRRIRKATISVAVFLCLSSILSGVGVAQPAGSPAISPAPSAPSSPASTQRAQEHSLGVHGPASSPPTPSAMRFGGWEFSCSLRGEATSCRAIQRLVEKERGETVFLATILPAEQKGHYVGIFSAPLGGYLTPGMELKVDRGKPFRVLFETCNAAGCHGGFEMSGRVLKEMRSGKELAVRLWTTKNRPVDIKVTLEGFVQAFEALRKQS